MQPVLNDYKCLACGHLFESFTAKCPECDAGNVAKLYLQAPSIRTSQSATVMYKDEFTHDLCTADQGTETIDVCGNELYKEGGPRSRSENEGKLAWGENNSQQLLSKFGLQGIVQERKTVAGSDGKEHKSLPINTPKDSGEFETALKFAKENKSRIMSQ